MFEKEPPLRKLCIICQELNREIALRHEVKRFGKYFNGLTLESYFNERANPKFKNYTLTNLETAYRLASADYKREIDRLLAPSGPAQLPEQTQEH